MKIKFEIVKYTDMDVLCPYKIIFKEDKWYKPWHFLLTESIAGNASHFAVSSIKRSSEVIESIGNPFEHNKKILNNAESKKRNCSVVKEYN